MIENYINKSYYNFQTLHSYSKHYNVLRGHLINILFEFNSPNYLPTIAQYGLYGKPYLNG